MARRSFLTTFEISEICEVNPTTVQNWVRENKLRAFVTPGGHRRVRREDLIVFMKKFGMPLPRGLENEHRLVLVVDDEQDICNLLVSLIESSGENLEVAAVHSGVEALLFIGERKPDLVILDIMIPGMNGIDVCQKLRSNPSTENIKVVAITGSHNPEIKDRILDAGADLFCTKPLDLISFRDQCLELIRP